MSLVRRPRISHRGPRGLATDDSEPDPAADHDGTRRPDGDTPPRFPRIATRVGASSATGVPALPPAATPRPRAPWTDSLGWQQRQAPSLHKPTQTTTRQREALAPARTPRIPVRGGPGPPSRSTTVVRSNDRARTLPRAPRRSRPARRPRSGAQAAQEEQAGRRPAVPPATGSSEHAAPGARISSAPRWLRRPPVWRQGPPPNHRTPDDLHPPHRHLLRPGRGPNRSTRQNRDHAPGCRRHHPDHARPAPPVHRYSRPESPVADHRCARDPLSLPPGHRHRRARGAPGRAGPRSRKRRR